MAKTDNLCDDDAVALVEQIRRGDVSAREVLDAHVSRIDARNGDINAFTELCIDRAWREARAADVRLARGESLGPLHGLPIATRI